MVELHQLVWRLTISRPPSVDGDVCRRERPMKHVIPALTITVGVVAATGCLNERVYVDPNSNASFEGAGAPNNLNLADGTLRGDFGPRRGFDGNATEMQGSSDPEWRTSTVTVARS